MDFNGVVQWATLIFLCSFGGALVVLAWRARGMFSDIQAKIAESEVRVMTKVQEVADTQQRTAANLDGRLSTAVAALDGKTVQGLLTMEAKLTQRIDDSRHFVRNEIHAKIGEVDTDIKRLHDTTVSHIATDGQIFREHGERIATLEARRVNGGR